MPPGPMRPATGRSCGPSLRNGDKHLPAVHIHEVMADASEHFLGGSSRMGLGTQQTADHGHEQGGRQALIRICHIAQSCRRDTAESRKGAVSAPSRSSWKRMFYLTVHPKPIIRSYRAATSILSGVGAGSAVTSPALRVSVPSCCARKSRVSSS
jgi:hypothetical protein